MPSTKKKAAAAPRTPKRAAKPLKTAPTKASAAAFLGTLDDATAADCARIDAWMRKATGAVGVMYGKAIVGYGSSKIRYADGREAEWMKIGFSPRKQALTLYGVIGAATPAALEKLGKHTTGKGCLYIKRLSDIDVSALQKIIEAAARRAADVSK